MIVEDRRGREVNYQLYLTSDSGERLDTLKTFTSLECSKVINQIAAFNITLPLSFDRNLINEDNMIQVWREPTGGRLRLWNVYFIRKWRFFYQGANEYATLEGPDIMDLLRRRIVAAFAGSAQASKSDAADDMMKEVVTESIADGVDPTPDAGTRVWSDLSIQADFGLGATITQSFPFKTLLTKNGAGILDIISRASKEEGNQIFFAIEPNVISSISATYEFRTYLDFWQDVSERVVFSRESGTLRDPYLEEDHLDEVNYVYATGQGEEETREVQQVYDSDRYSKSQWNRCEIEADARDQDSPEAVTSKGNQALNDGRPRRRSGGIPLDTNKTRFGRDWDVGYKVGFKYEPYQFNTLVWAAALSVRNGREDIQSRLDYEGLL